MLFFVSVFKSTAFERDKFILRPQCLAFPPPSLGGWVSDAAQAYLRYYFGSCSSLSRNCIRCFIIYAFNLFVTINYFQNSFGSKN